MAKSKKNNETNEGIDIVKKKVTEKSFQFENVAKKCYDQVCQQKQLHHQKHNGKKGLVNNPLKKGTKSDTNER